MNKLDYLNQLESILKKHHMSKAEIDDIIRDYAEFFEEGRRQGQSDGEISAKLGTGIDELRNILAETQKNVLTDSDTTLVTNQRHVQALTDARTSLLRVREGLASGLPTDLAAQDIREAIYHLGSIVGEISTDEVLGNIFRNFCIGK